jgi:hypothetical protein
MELVEGDSSRAAHCLKFPLSSPADTLGSRHDGWLFLHQLDTFAADVDLVSKHRVLDDQLPPGAAHVDSHAADDPEHASYEPFASKFHRSCM